MEPHWTLLTVHPVQSGNLFRRAHESHSSAALDCFVRPTHNLHDALCVALAPAPCPLWPDTQLQHWRLAIDGEQQTVVVAAPV